MKRLALSLAAALLSGLALAGCEDDDDPVLVPVTQAETLPTDSTLLFEPGVASIESHVFPSDEYLDRSTVALTGFPLLTTTAVRAALGLPADTADGGFSDSQSSELPFLNQLGISGQFAYAPISRLRIPFDAGSSPVTLTSVAAALAVYDLGDPSYASDPPTLSTGAATAVEVGEMTVDSFSKALTFRPRFPLRVGAGGLSTYGVVVRANTLRTEAGGSVGVSRHYAAIQGSNNAPLSGDFGSVGLASQAELDAVNRHLSETAEGFAKVMAADNTITRATTACYFQITVKNDTGELVLLRSIVNGLIPGSVNQTGNPADSTTLSTLGLESDPLAMMPDPNAIRVDLSAAEVFTGGSISTLYDQTFGAAGSGASGTFETVIYNSANNLTVLIDNEARWNEGVFNGGQVVLGSTLQGFFVLDNTAVSVVVGGDARPYVTLSPEPYSISASNTNGAAVLAAQGTLAIDRVVRATLHTPRFVSPDVDPATQPSNPAIPFTNGTFLGNDLTQPFSLANTVIRQWGTNALEYLAFFPPGASGTTPVVLAVHGIGRSKEDMLLLANAVCGAGHVLIVVDTYQHGARQVTEGLFDFATIPVLGDFPDPFVNPSFLARTRDKLRQTVVDELAVLRLLSSGVPIDPAANPTINYDSTEIRLIGQSLGGIYGATITAVAPEVERAVLNVSGGGLGEVLDDSTSLRRNLDALVAGTASLDDVVPAAQFVLLAGTDRRMTRPSVERELLNMCLPVVFGAFDPLSYASTLFAAAGSGSLRNGPPSGGVLLQVALNDTVVPNDANTRLAEAFAAGSSGTAFHQVGTELFDIPFLTDSTTPFLGSGVTQFEAGHGFLLNGNDPAIVAGQTQAATFLATGQITQ